jgi:hypothetical protein
MKSFPCSLLALTLCTLTDAFQKLAPFGVRSHSGATKKLSMVAGGAERAYGEEYYDGENCTHVFTAVDSVVVKIQICTFCETCCCV